MQNLILSILSTLALLIYPLSVSAQNSFSISLDVNGLAGDQAVTSLNVSPDQVVAIQIFGQDIRNANGLAVRFEYDASQVVYEGFDAGDVLPNAQALPEQGTNPTFVEIGIVSLGGQATANSGLVGTVRFRTTATFSGSEIRLVRAELSRGGRFETITPNIRIALQGAPTPANFSLSLDVDGSAGDQAVTSANVSTDEVVAIQIFGQDIRNANGVSIRFEYDASQVTYEGFDVGDVLPNAQSLPEQGTNPTFIQIGIVSLGSQATANSGLVGTIRFRTMDAFSGTAIRLVRAELGRGGQIASATMDVRIELILQVLTPDFNGDGVVNFADFLAFAGQFGARQSDEKYDAKYDLDSDGAIGFGDFLIFSSSFGKEVSMSGSGSTTTVTILDANLRAVIADSLGKARGAPITRAEMARLTRLRAPNKNISDLTGLEFAKRLTNLDLGFNNIADIAPLSGLTNLTYLNLTGNSISDLSPLVANTGLGSGDVVDVRNNPLNATSINMHIPALQGRGVGFDTPIDANRLDDLSLSIKLKNDSNYTISTGVIVVHNEHFSMNYLGRQAPAEYESLAEVGDPSALIARLEVNPNIYHVIKTNVLEPNSERVLTVSRIAETVRVSYMAMITETNDGVVWSNSRSINSRAWTEIIDMGTEQNSPIGSGFSGGQPDPTQGANNIDNGVATNEPVFHHSQFYDDPAISARIVLLSITSFIDDPTPVSIPDANLRAVIADSLGKARDAPITKAEMFTLTRLGAPNANISDLTGLEFATRLTELDLSRNRISDVTPLSNLTNLTWLNLSGNSISDITPLSDLTNLAHLYLSDNSISDITPLSNLTNLTYLGLSSNSISDVTPLSNLTNLRSLGLSSNSISDVSVLSNLTNLEWLFLGRNSISDITPLIANTGLGEGDKINATNNPLNVTSINTLIPVLQGRGVEVYFDPTPISDDPTPVSISDTNLRAVIADSLDKASGATITRADMSTLTRLEAPNTNISDLTGLEFATRLTWLDLGSVRVGRTHVNSNHISDLSPLSGLTNLRSLDLSHNLISDLTPLSNLTNLTGLPLEHNLISDLTPLSGLTNLRSLYLTNNLISDLTPLYNLTNLRWLLLGYNSITNITPLSGLTNLTGLLLGYNSITNITPLSGLTNLRELWLYNNSITNIASLSNLTNLTTLYLFGNRISDLAPLIANTGLDSGDEVDVRNNPLSDTSLNMHIPALQGRGVDVHFGASKPTVEEKERGMKPEDWEVRTPPHRPMGKPVQKKIRRPDSRSL